MSISSFFLVCYDYEKEEVCRAGWLYFMATHLGAAFLFFFFQAAATQSGSLDFASFSALKSLSPTVTGGMFVLILLGFGAKAGLFPMHVWLPEAHPAAPSHVSALMSGVMIKTAVYGFLRMLTFLPPLPQWCVIVVITSGLIGAVFGITMAASQNDIKRSLAYSTVENINLIFLGLGLWLFGVNADLPVMAGLALIGALLHVWNHALFKGLLFMGAGSVLHGTGSRFFSHFGGLLRRMPVSGGMLIFGGAAIAGLPPLNGFISELYLYLSVVVMGREAAGITAFSALLVLSMMILTGGLVLFTVCRLVGMVLLGEPRVIEAEQASESAPLMLFSMALLCGLCLLIGVAPSLPLSVIDRPLQVLAVLPGKSLDVLPFLFSKEWTVWSVILLLGFVGFLLTRSRTMHGAPRASTWGCGFQRPTRRMVYAAGGFTQLAQDTFFCSCVSPRNEMVSSPVLFREGATFAQKIIDPVFFHVFKPFFAKIADRAHSFRRLQAGKLNIYLLYIFIATILLLGLDVYQNV
jgi:formate hydrogenlyase subunit 3/multisubunit Na+/H+ antiporter MnhD subunit